MALRRSPDVTFEVVDGRAILIDAAGKELITLNPVGTLVWNALDGVQDADGLAAELVSSLQGVTIEQLTQDIRTFLGELQSSELVIEADAGR
jgi:hypothetical protein